MAGPLAEKIVGALARNHIDGCEDAFKSVRLQLGKIEGNIGVVPMSSIALASDYLAQDARAHGGGALYVNHGGRVGDRAQT